MDINAVVDEIAARMREITGLRVYEWPVGKVDGPACVVSYPDDEIDYYRAYQHGTVKISGLPVIIVYPRPNELATRKALLGWCATNGTNSVRRILDHGKWASCDDVTVTSCTFDRVELGGVDYMAAMFKLDITGGGR